MKTYLFPIKVALILFPLLVAALCIPYAVYNYRKYGNINKLKTFIFYTFIFYSITAFFMTILPLPRVDKPRFSKENYIQLIPFNFINDFLSKTKVVWNNPKTYLHVFSEPAFMQVFFNAILLLPLGIYLRYYFKKTIKQTIIISFLVSLFFEITQLTGIYGIYTYPYRLFDVDDLILNTFGGLIGYFIEPLFSIILPDINKLKIKTFTTDKYSAYPKRILAFFIDWTLCFLFFDPENIFIFVIVTFLYFILIPYLTNGFTIAKKLLKMRLRGEHDKLTFIEIFKRYSILMYCYFMPNYILNSAQNYLQSLEKYDFLIIVFILQLFLVLFGFIHLLSHIIKKDPILLHDKISGVKNIDIS